MPGKLTVLIGVATILFVTVGFERLLGAPFVGLFVGCLLATAVVSLVSSEDERLATAIVFALFAVGALAALVVQQFRALGAPAALAIDLGLVAGASVGVWYAAYGRRRRADARLLRDTAARLGWAARAPDADLVRRVRLLFPAVRDRARALHAAIEGTVDGVPLTLVTGRAVEQAWLFRLPFGLPPLEVMGADGGRNNPAHRALDQALVTPEVYAAARSAAVVDCRVERGDAVVRMRPVGDADTLAGHARRVAAVVGAMPFEAARPFAVDPATVPDPALWAYAAGQRRDGVRVGAGIAAVVAVVVLACGGWNVRIPGHETGSYIMFGIGGGAIALAALAWSVAGRGPARTPQ